MKQELIGYENIKSKYFWSPTISDHMAQAYIYICACVLFDPFYGDRINSLLKGTKPYTLTYNKSNKKIPNSTIDIKKKKITNKTQHKKLYLRSTLDSKTPSILTTSSSITANPSHQQLSTSTRNMLIFSTCAENPSRSTSPIEPTNDNILYINPPNNILIQ